MDEFEVGKILAGGFSAERDSVSSPNATSTIYGEATSDSVEGYVDVYIDGQTCNIETNVAVKNKDSVQISVVGGRMIVVGVVGRGDEQAVEIEQASDRYTLTSNAPTISFYPDGTVLPQDITFAAWIQKGSKGAKTAYEGTLVIEVSPDGETWIEFDSLQASTVAVACADFEAALPGFAFVQVTLWAVEEVDEGSEPSEDFEPVELAALMISRVNEAAHYMTKNDAGLWMHETEGAENFNVDGNLRLTSDGLDINFGTTLLARLKAVICELGIGAASAVIRLCDGMVEITGVNPANSSEKGAFFNSLGDSIRTLVQKYVSGGTTVNSQVYQTASDTRATLDARAHFNSQGSDMAEAHMYASAAANVAYAEIGASYDDATANRAIIRTQRSAGAGGIWIALNAQSGNLTDWVVEESTNKNPNNGWVWRKWASGIAEGWYNPSWTGAINTAWGVNNNTHRSEFVGNYTLPFAFIVAPMVTRSLMPVTNGDGLQTLLYTASTTTTTGQIFLGRNGTALSSATVRIGTFVQGYWK